MTDNITRWLVEGERGLSSETMAAVALGLAPKRPSFPLDPSDLNRCIKLVDAAPEVKRAFPRIAALSPQWVAVIGNWDLLRTSFVDEAGYDWSKARSAPETYKLMKNLGINFLPT